MSLKLNRSFQFLVGAFVIVLAWKLYQSGFADVLFAEPGENSDGVESLSLLTLLLSGVVSSVQLIGLLALMLVSGLEPLATSVVEYLGGMISKLLPRKKPTWYVSPEKKEASLDVDKMANVLDSILSRLESLEEKQAIDKPASESE